MKIKSPPIFSLARIVQGLSIRYLVFRSRRPAFCQSLPSCRYFSAIRILLRETTPIICVSTPVLCPVAVLALVFRPDATEHKRERVFQSNKGPHMVHNEHTHNNGRWTTQQGVLTLSLSLSLSLFPSLRSFSSISASLYA